MIHVGNISVQANGTDGILIRQNGQTIVSHWKDMRMIAQAIIGMTDNRLREMGDDNQRTGQEASDRITTSLDWSALKDKP